MKVHVKTFDKCNVCDYKVIHVNTYKPSTLTPIARIDKDRPGQHKESGTRKEENCTFSKTYRTA